MSYPPADRSGSHLASRRARRLRRPAARASLILALGLALSTLPAAAQRRSPAEELIEQERVRTEVQQAFGLYYGSARDGGMKAHNMNIALGRLEVLGEPAVPHLASELERSQTHNFMFVAIALGRIGTPEAGAALRQAAEVADGEDNEFAPIKRAWACYALAMMGEVDGVTLLGNGRHRAGQLPAHDESTILEVAALYTAPASVAPLHAGFDRLFKNLESRDQLRELIATTAALKLVGAPASIPRLLEALKSDDARIRREAADSLGVFPTDEVVTALLQVLRTDDTPPVRYSAGWSLEQMLPESQLEAVLALLESETDGNVRAVLYRLVVKLGGAATLGALRPYLGGPIMEDREGLLRALRLMDNTDTFPIFRAALNDSSTRVVAQAVRGLVELGDTRSIDTLIQSINSPRWIVAFLAVRGLADADVERAAPIIAKRLVGQELASIVTDSHLRDQVFELGNALVAFNYHQVLDTLRPVAEPQRDGHLKVYLESLERQLEAIKENGVDTERWGAALLAEDESLRAVAARRLAEIGTPEAAQVLTAAFRRVDMDVGRTIMRELGRVDQPAARQLIERVLTTEAFDDYVRRPLRYEAGYSAYRLGGADMIDALRRAWERRAGLEGRLMVYYAALAGPAAIEPLERYRVSRMRYHKWTRGQELETLNMLLRELRAGRGVALLARPPARVNFRRTSWLPL